MALHITPRFRPGEVDHRDGAHGLAMLLAGLPVASFVIFAALYLAPGNPLLRLLA